MTTKIYLHDSYPNKDEICIYNEGNITVVTYSSPIKLEVGTTIYQRKRFYDLKIDDIGELTIEELTAEPFEE